MAGRRGPTAFFVFSEEQREATRAECLAAAEPGAKVSVATVAKAIGEKWRGLSDEDKAAYKEKAAQRAAEAAASQQADAEEAAAAEGADAEPGEEGEEGQPSQRKQKQGQGEGAADAAHASNPFGFPLSLVKRVMCMDPDVSRITGDGLKAVAKATELLLEHMASRAAAAARAAKRKTVKFCDVERAVRGDARLVDAGLRDVLQEDTFAEARQPPLRNVANRANTAGGAGAGEAAAEEAAPGSKERAVAAKGPSKKKAKEDDGRARQITEFFKA